MLFGAIAIFYGLQALMAGAPLQTTIFQFVIGGLMLGIGIWNMIRGSRRVGTDDMMPEHVSKECIQNNHAFCTDPVCRCRCGHRGIH